MSDKISGEISTKSKGGLVSKRLVLILIPLCIILLVAGGIGISYILPKNISGAWELVVNPEIAVATADEIPEGDRAYYVFDKPDRYGRGEYCTFYQGGVEYYKYELMEENKVKKINLGSEDMEYSITGSKLLGNAKLTIIYPGYTNESTGAVYEAEEYIFEQSKDPKYEKMSYGSFETDSNIIGEKYTSNQRTLAYYYYDIPYTQTVEFTDDGVMVIRYESKDLALDRYMYYAYTAKNGELTFSLVTDIETKYTVGYELDDESNLKFTDDKTASSIFADAFFGDFTFYTQENVPEPTASSADEMYLVE